jgi:thiol-disulfide isomerase/thioredoxin
VRSLGGAAAVQRGLGVVMLATALAIVTGVDLRFDQLVARDIPGVNLTAGLERSGAVRSRLDVISGPRRTFTAASPAHGGGLPVLGAAPGFAGTGRWFNTPGDRPEPLRALRGRVVLVDFWTYTCINCLRTLPYLEAWDARYRRAGLTVVGVHTPEFGFEHDAGNVADAVRRLGIRYPVVQDNRRATWDAYGNQYWPADYLVDARGRVRFTAFGEGDYGRTEAAIRSLLEEARGRPLGAGARPRGVVHPSFTGITPETYLGSARADGWLRPPRPGLASYSQPSSALAPGTFAFGGTWDVRAQPATAVEHATIDAQVRAKRVYLVLSSAGGRPRAVQVRLDGRPIRSAAAGADVRGGRVTVTGQRLYSLVALPRPETHRLTLRFSPGVSGYAFTFG